MLLLAKVQVSVVVCGRAVVVYENWNAGAGRDRVG
jgi:hypothetical protein